MLDDRIGNRSTLITSHLPVRHTDLDDPTVADAILNGVVHSTPQDRAQRKIAAQQERRQMTKHRCLVA